MNPDEGKPLFVVIILVWLYKNFLIHRSAISQRTEGTYHEGKEKDSGNALYGGYDVVHVYAGTYADDCVCR